MLGIISLSANKRIILNRIISINFVPKLNYWYNIAILGTIFLGAIILCVELFLCESKLNYWYNIAILGIIFLSAIILCVELFLCEAKLNYWCYIIMLGSIYLCLN